MMTYVLTVSVSFPKTHKKVGTKTGFPLSIENHEKIHTIRGNYELWAKRFEKIGNGKAVLSLRIWEGKPYKSKQIELFRYDNTHNIGIEKILFDDMLSYQIGNERFFDIQKLAKNDGLSEIDFKEWFKGYDLSKPMAIIHFTGFRYVGKNY